MSLSESNIPKKHSSSVDFAGRKLTLETGSLAYQANGAVRAQYGDTVVLATVVRAKAKEDVGYFPLSVFYTERLYAGGKIKTSRFMKREGRPSDQATLTSRLIDRSIRPLFPSAYQDEVQVIITVLSVDDENDPGLLSLIATSAAIGISDIPWNGPIAGVRVGYKNAEFVLDPSIAGLQDLEFNMVLAFKGQETLMIEAEGDQVPEEQVEKAMDFGLEKGQSLYSFVADFVKAAGVEKLVIPVDESLETVKAAVMDYIEKEILAGHPVDTSLLSKDWQLEQGEKLFVQFEGKTTKAVLADFLESAIAQKVRQQVIEDKKRIDGRGVTEIRPLEVSVGVLPRTHGSGLFQRGLSQALTVATLGSTSLEQLIEGMSGEERKRYIHHYYFPPFCAGETGRIGAPGRREIGHGALAEKALEPVIPPQESFPYTIHLVTEVLSSAGSTSMAATCGSTLALMDAGVPIKAPVAGIAMGLVQEGDQSVILTDAAYAEDAFGDMDFKVTGTEKGVTAIQLDMKVEGLSLAVLKEGLKGAREARLIILKKMISVIASPRSELSKYAPRVEIIKIDPSKIGSVIGPGGKVINEIIRETGVAIDIDDDGTVNVTSEEPEGMKKAIAWVKRLTHEVKVGDVYIGEVRRIMPFGAFVELVPGQDGMVHISELSDKRVENINQEVHLGEKMKVKVIEIDSQGRVNLSKKRVGADEEPTL